MFIQVFFLNIGGSSHAESSFGPGGEHRGYDHENGSKARLWRYDVDACVPCSTRYEYLAVFKKQMTLAPKIMTIERVQLEGKKEMDAGEFLNRIYAFELNKE
ncbi:hypothetical protein ACTFIW_000824 [Dictyostelium discoideum]